MTEELAPTFQSKAEAAYGELLEAMRLCGEIREWHYEYHSLTVAFDGDEHWERRYTPDFYVVLSDGRVELHEVKGGYMSDAASLRVVVAASMYPQYVFRVCRRYPAGWVRWLIGPDRDWPSPFDDRLNPPVAAAREYKKGRLPSGRARPRRRRKRGGWQELVVAG